LKPTANLLFVKRTAMRETFSFALLLLLGLFVSGCSSSRDHVRLRFTRLSDTLRVELDPAKSASWSPNHDSIVIDCKECYTGKSHVVDNFQNHSQLTLDLSTSSKLRLGVYRGSKLDTTYSIDAEDISDTRAQDAAARKRELDQTGYKRTNTVDSSSDSEETTTKASSTTTKTGATHPTTLRITAREGVAIYKDKSKREVLKILPRGTVISYLALEGEVYSVLIDDVEGFVDSDAVQVIK